MWETRTAGAGGAASRPAAGIAPRARLTAAALALLLGALAALPGGARADLGSIDLPWPQLLPPRPGGAEVQPGPVPRCEEPTVACVDQLIERLREQWLELEARCDHRALFPRAYLLITEGLRAELVRPDKGLLRHRRWMTTLITTFSNRYFEAYEDWEQGRPVPASWRIKFDEATRGDVTAAQDVLLASNAHTQHDLPFALAEVGLRTPDGRSRKSDHDAVNRINNAVFSALAPEFAERWDPSFAIVDAEPTGALKLLSLETVKTWRERAWRNAERLLRARTPARRRAVERSIRRTSTRWARLIRSVALPGYRQVRQEHCRAAGPR